MGVQDEYVFAVRIGRHRRRLLLSETVSGDSGNFGDWPSALGMGAPEKKVDPDM